MSAGIEVTFLGTGTSTGVPEIGCRCKTCTSTDPRDKRLRASVLIRKGAHQILIDCGPDFRTQMLKGGVEELDAVFLTHEHYDHVGGLDDLRPFLRNNRQCPIYAEDKVRDAIRTRMPYVFKAHPYPGVPHLDLHPAMPFVPIRVAPGFVVEPIRVLHGKLPILGYMIGDFVYITDAKLLPPETVARIAGHTDTLVLNALRTYEHMAHFTLAEALDARERIAPKGETYLTHFTHTFGTHDEITALMPPGVLPAYDGLRINA